MRGVRLVAICAVVACALLTIVALWNAEPVINQGVPHNDPHAPSLLSAVVAVQPKSALQGVGREPEAQAPPRDLAEAITRVQAGSGSQPLSSTEQSSVPRRGTLSAEEAPKTFEEAVKALEMKRQVNSSSVSPFGPVKN